MPSKKQKKNKVGKRRPANNSWGHGYTSMSIAVQPRPKPMHRFSRVVQGRFDYTTTSIAPTLDSLVFTLDQLPDYQDFTNLYQMYRIVKVDIEWLPEYTELTDAALVSNAMNTYVNTALDQTNSTMPASIQTVTQYQNVKSTSVTKPHRRVIEVSNLMSGIPCSCFLSTQNPSERHYGCKIGIDPTGIAMTFRSRATFYIEVCGAN